MATRNGSANARLGFRVLNLAGNVADIDIFDVIGDSWEGTTAADFIKELRSLKNVSQINLHINSPGGYVSDAIAIYNAIQQHPANVNAFIESEAASAASFVAMAADKVSIYKTAKMMIHDADSIGFGNATEFRSMADILDEESNNIAGIYADKTGLTVAHWRAAMQANNGEGTTYRGQEAVTAGLADEVIVGAVKMGNQSTRRMALQMSRVAALGNEPTTSTVTAAFGACLYDALTDMAQDWLEDGVITMDEFLPLSNLVTELVSAMDTGLDKLGLSDRVIPAPDDDEGMIPMPGMAPMDRHEEILTDLIPPLANGYKAPLPDDFTRLLEANFSATKG